MRIVMAEEIRITITSEKRYEYYKRWISLPIGQREK